jgi:hypothetical protein
MHELHTLLISTDGADLLRLQWMRVRELLVEGCLYRY